MRDLMISAVAVLVLLTCVTYLALTGFTGGSLQRTNSVVAPTANSVIDHPPFITFFPSS